MTFKPLLAVAAALLILPATAHAETGTQSQVDTPQATRYKETTVLKGYKVKNSYVMPSAPVVGEPKVEQEVYVPVEAMVDLPPAAGDVAIEQRTVYRSTSRQGAYNE